MQAAVLAIPEVPAEKRPLAQLGQYANSVRDIAYTTLVDRYFTV